MRFNPHVIAAVLGVSWALLPASAGRIIAAQKPTPNNVKQCLTVIGAGNLTGPPASVTAGGSITVTVGWTVNYSCTSGVTSLCTGICIAPALFRNYCSSGPYTCVNNPPTTLTDNSSGCGQSTAYTTTTTCGPLEQAFYEIRIYAVPAPCPTFNLNWNLGRVDG